MRFPTSIASGSIALLATLVSTSSATAQLAPQAFYPLRVDLADFMGFYGDVSLLGTPGPTGPSDDGVCVNGIYRFGGGANWTEFQTPDISGLNQNDFQINLDFNIAVLPSNRMPIIMGGNGWRWIGMYVDSAGLVGIIHNNANYVWSTTTTVVAGTWYSAELKYEGGTVEFYINGVQTLPVGPNAIGALSTNNDFDFMPTNYSNGAVYNGCIRNLQISNDTTLGVPTVVPYGTACGPNTGGTGPAIGWQEYPLIGNPNFGIKVSNASANAPAFLVFGAQTASLPLSANCTQWVNWPLDTAGFALTDPNGALTAPIPVPNSASLAGAFGYFQWATVDAAGPFLNTFTVSDAIGFQVN